jgi:hypothetical protein
VSFHLQAFMETYNILRDELVKDDGTLGNPPPHAVEWFSEVRWRDVCTS